MPHSVWIEPYMIAAARTSKEIARSPTGSRFAAAFNIWAEKSPATLKNDTAVSSGNSASKEEMTGRQHESANLANRPFRILSAIESHRLPITMKAHSRHTKLRAPQIRQSPTGDVMISVSVNKPMM